MISDGAISIGKMHFACPVPDDNPTELEGKWGVDGTWIDPKLLIAGRKEEMEYIMKMGVFEVVDEKECYDNGCKPLKLKWVDTARMGEPDLRLPSPPSSNSWRSNTPQPHRWTLLLLVHPCP